MKRYEFNKLIRNKLHARMSSQGVKINGQNLTLNQYKEKLKEKLVEEANEVALAQDIEDIEIELADVLEVIDSLAQAYNIKYENIILAKHKKNSTNGTFDLNSYVNYIEVAKDNTKVINYLEDKHRSYKLEV